MGSMKWTALAASVGLLVSSTAATAAPAAKTSIAQPTAPNAWMMLSMLGPTRSVALGGAAVAAQPTEVPPPHPAAYGAAGPAFSGEVLPVFLWFGLIAIALTISGPNGRPNSAH